MFAHLGPETLLVSLALLLALAYPQLGARWFERAEQMMAALARKRGLSVLICGLSALTFRLALLQWMPIPKPFINDEFSFLLAGDTFAHGRLTNPTHPMWMHLETFHVIFHPTYASMYPPMSGLLLALGQIALGHPFWGVWLSVGLMCASFCWMLQAWLPPSWALLGGMIPVMRFGVLSYWDNAYWGGALAATGGALVLGALPRITRHQRTRDAVLMATGVAMLVNTRPYEGMMLCLVVGVMLAAWFVRNRPEPGPVIRRVAVPMLLMLALAGSLSLYYSWRVTGNPLRLPQQVNRDSYAIARYFYWQSAYPEPVYHHKAIQDFYRGPELVQFQQAHRFLGIVRQLGIKTTLIWIFYFGPVLTLPLFFFGRIIRDRRIRLLVIAGAVGLASSALVVFFNLHYIAPIVCIMVAVLLQGMRHLRTWRWEGRPTGQFLVRATVVMCVVMIPIEVHNLAPATTTKGIFMPGQDSLWQTWAAIGPERAALEDELKSLPGSHLIVVHYTQDHNPLLEWVYNLADIDGQKIVWARDMGSQRNEELLRYYSDRRVWLLDADNVPPKLLPYAESVNASVRAVDEGKN